MATITISREGNINEEATRLYQDILKAERELSEVVEHSIKLEDLECIRDLQIEIEYRMNLFRQYIESMR